MTIPATSSPNIPRRIVETKIVRSYDFIIRAITDRGLKPCLQCMDNALRFFLAQEDIQLQLAPPHMHHHNDAEYTNQALKTHFVAVMCYVDLNYPLTPWDKLLSQAIITLYLIGKSRINPHMSTYVQLNGNFDFNRVIMSPPGARVIAHEKPDQRNRWAPNSMHGWYIGRPCP
jgi:hypothetical protein